MIRVDVEVLSGRDLPPRLQEFKRRLDKIFIRETGDYLYRAKNVAGNKYMQKGRIEIHKDPPNPPPGPLKKRTQRLRLSMRVVDPIIGPNDKDSFKGTLLVDLRYAPYGYIHEYGGTISRSWASRFKIIDPKGKSRFRQHKSGTIVIGARPYLRPALADEYPRYLRNLDAAVVNLGARF